MLSLTSGGAVLELLPELGGAVGRFAVQGRDVLRAAPAGAADVRQTACFPLVPFFGRARDGRFAFRGETIQLPAVPGFAPHALHGQGWRAPWRIESDRAESATLVFDHAAGDWPWAYEARQVFTLSADSFRVELALTSRAARPMPFSLGLHPYFERAADAILRAEVGGVWLADENVMPTERAAPDALLDLANGAPLGNAPFVDNTHFGWKHRAAIARRGRIIELTSDADFLHVFLPKGEGFFCVEPVTAMPGAFDRAAQSDSGFRVLESGATATIAMTVAVRA